MRYFLLLLLLPLTGFATTIVATGSNNAIWLAADRRGTIASGAIFGTHEETTKIALFGKTAVAIAGFSNVYGFHPVDVAGIACQAGRNFDERLQAIEIVLRQYINDDTRKTLIPLLGNQPGLLEFVLVEYEHGINRLGTAWVEIPTDEHKPLLVSVRKFSGIFYFAIGSEATQKLVQSNPSFLHWENGEVFALKSLINAGARDGTNLTGDGINIVRSGPDGISFPDGSPIPTSTPKVPHPADAGLFFKEFASLAKELLLRSTVPLCCLWLWLVLRRIRKREKSPVSFG